MNLTKSMLSLFLVKTPTLGTFSTELENYMKLKLSKQGTYTDTVVANKVKDLLFRESEVLIIFKSPL